MKTRDVIYMAGKNLKRRRFATGINILLLTLSFVVILVSEMFYSAFSKMENRLFDSVEGRTIVFVDDKEGIAEEVTEYFKDDKRVEYAGEYLEMHNVQYNLSDVAGNRYDGGMFVIGYNPSYSKYISDSENKIENIADDEIYIPKYLNIEGKVNENAEDKIDYFEGDELIGQTICISVNICDYASLKTIRTDEYQLKVVGTYDNFAYGNMSFDSIVSSNTASKINDWLVYDEDGKYSNEYTTDIKNEYIQEQNINTVQVVVSKYKYLDEVIEEISNKLGIENASTVGVQNENIDTIMSIISAVRYAGYVLTLVAFINVAVTLAKSINNRKKDFATLMAMGYRNSYVKKILLSELAIIYVVAAVLSYIIYTIVNNVVNHYVQANMDLYVSSIHMGITAVVWLTRCLLMLFAVFVAYKAGTRKLKSMNLASELKTMD